MYATRNTLQSTAFHTTSQTDCFISFSFCRDSLQDHVANSHWHSPTWNVSHEKPLRRFVIPQDITSHSPFSTVSHPSYGPFSSQSTSISQYPNLTSSPSRAFQVPNFGRLNVSTSGSSNHTLSSDAILPRSTSSMSSDTRTPMVGFPPSSNPFSHRRSSTSIVSYLSCKSISILGRHFDTISFFFFFFVEFRVIDRTFIGLHTNGSTSPPARTLWPLSF